MSAETRVRFSSWDDKRWAAGSLLDEAHGWGRKVDQSNDAEVLAWARQYLPRIVALGEREVVTPPAQVQP